MLGGDSVLSGGYCRMMAPWEVSVVVVVVVGLGWDAYGLLQIYVVGDKCAVEVGLHQCCTVEELVPFLGATVLLIPDGLIVH
jgi:hypothetical protein